MSQLFLFYNALYLDLGFYTILFSLGFIVLIFSVPVWYAFDRYKADSFWDEMEYKYKIPSKYIFFSQDNAQWMAWEAILAIDYENKCFRICHRGLNPIINSLFATKTTWDTLESKYVANFDDVIDIDVQRIQGLAPTTVWWYMEFTFKGQKNKYKRTYEEKYTKKIPWGASDRKENKGDQEGFERDKQFYEHYAFKFYLQDLFAQIKGYNNYIEYYDTVVSPGSGQHIIELRQIHYEDFEFYGVEIKSTMCPVLGPLAKKTQESNT